MFFSKEPPKKGRISRGAYRGDIRNEGLRGAVGPGKRALERVEEVEEAPHDDGVVVDGHHVGRDGAGQPHAAHERVHLVPHPQAPQPHLLTDGQLQVQQRHALHEQHDQVRDEEGA